MIRWILAVSLAVSAILVAGCSQEVQEIRPVEAYLNDVIQPEYTELVRASETLEGRSRAFCEKPDDERFQNLEDQWRQTMQAWQRAEAVGQIYLEDNMDRWRFQFWPDKKNLVGRKVEQLLRKEVQGSLQEESVIVQGISALEYLIFDPERGQAILGDDKRCRLLQSVSSALVHNSQDINRNWYTEGEFFEKTTSTEADEIVEVPVLVLNSLDVLVSRLIREVSLPLGKTKPNYYLAESWRSEHSMSNLATSLDSAERMIAFVQKHPDFSEQKEVWANLSASIASLKASVQQLSVSFKRAFERTEYTDIVALKEQLTGLRSSIQSSSGVLGVPLGFNASDGD